MNCGWPEGVHGMSIIDTIEYDEDENPLLYCLDYWVSGFIDFRIARRTYRENKSNRTT